MNYLKPLLFAGLLTLSVITNAAIFPGSTITLKEDLQLAESKDHRDWGSNDVVFQNGRKIEYQSEADTVGEVVCKIMGVDGRELINKGTFYSIGSMFHRYGANGEILESLRTKCYRSAYVATNPKAPFFEIDVDPTLLTKAFGNNVIFNYAAPEQFRASGITLTTGTKFGDDGRDHGGYGARQCNYSIFRVGNTYKLIMGAEVMSSCLINIEKSGLDKDQLLLSGKSSSGKEECSIRFFIKNGKTTNRVYMLNEYNWSSADCYVK